MRDSLRFVLLAIALIAASNRLPAQTAGNAAKSSTPKSTAPKSGIPDLSGYWNIKGGSPSWDPADLQGKNPDTLPMLPWAKAKLEAARPPFGANATFDSVNDPVQVY